MTKKNCCKEKTTVLKINDTQYSSLNIKTPESTVKSIDDCFAQVSLSLYQNTTGIKIISSLHAPPEIYQSPIYLQHRVLII